MKSNLGFTVACAILLPLCAGSAHADVFTWSYSGGTYEYSGVSYGTPQNGSGTLTTGALLPANLTSPAGYQITDITGSWNGISITGVYSGFSDNRLLPDAPLFDGQGLNFSLSDGNVVNLSFCDAVCFAGSNFSNGAYYATEYSGSFLPIGIPLSDSAGAFALPVPGPIAGTGVPGLIFASGGLLGWWRRRQKIA